MDDVMMAFVVGFITASLLFGVAWHNARQRVKQLESLLGRLGASLRDVLREDGGSR
jgi:uncharacterized membrane protein YciS (DUF1049 family)